MEVIGTFANHPQMSVLVDPWNVEAAVETMFEMGAITVTTKSEQFRVGGQQYNKSINRKGQKMAEKDNYYLVTYIENGRECVSAVHWRDMAKFRAEFEVISIVAQLSTGARVSL